MEPPKIFVPKKFDFPDPKEYIKQNPHLLESYKAMGPEAAKEAYKKAKSKAYGANQYENIKAKKEFDKNNPGSPDHTSIHVPQAQKVVATKLPKPPKEPKVPKVKPVKAPKLTNQEKKQLHNESDTTLADHKHSGGDVVGQEVVFGKKNQYGEYHHGHVVSESYSSVKVKTDTGHVVAVGTYGAKIVKKPLTDEEKLATYKSLPKGKLDANLDHTGSEIMYHTGDQNLKHGKVTNQVNGIMKIKHDDGTTGEVAVPGKIKMMKQKTKALAKTTGDLGDENKYPVKHNLSEVDSESTFQSDKNKVLTHDGSDHVGKQVITTNSYGEVQAGVIYHQSNEYVHVKMADGTAQKLDLDNKKVKELSSVEKPIPPKPFVHEQYKGLDHKDANPEEKDTPDHVAKLLADPKYQYAGLSILRDHDMVERNQITVRKNATEEGHIIEFKATEPYHTALTKAMTDNGGVKSSDMKVPSPSSSGSSYGVGNGVKHQLANGSEAKFFRDASSGQAYKGSVQFKTKENDPAKAYKEFETYLDGIGMSKAKSKMDASGSKKMEEAATHLLVHGNSSKTTKPEDYGDKKVELREVAPGHFAHVVVGHHEDLMAAGLMHTQINTHHPKSVLKVIESGGHQSTVERVKRGITKNSASPTADIQSGGADYVFTRGITTSRKGGNIDTSWGEIAFVYHPRVLDRTDWFGSQSDNYGNTKSSNYSGYEGGVAYVKQLKNNQKNGNTSSEITIKKATSVNDLMGVYVTDSNKHSEVIKLLKDAGHHEINGIPVEEFVQYKKKY